MDLLPGRVSETSNGFSMSATSLETGFFTNKQVLTNGSDFTRTLAVVLFELLPMAHIYDP